MSKTTIKTSHKWREFSYRHDVPKKVLKRQFDYQGDDDDTPIDGFFKYRGTWYHLDMFMRISEHAPEALLGFNGYHGDSYFSGVLIKLSDDGEQFQVATYYS